MCIIMADWKPAEIFTLVFSDHGDQCLGDGFEMI